MPSTGENAHQELYEGSFWRDEEKIKVVFDKTHH
jgi:hypothetical protein